MGFFEQASKRNSTKTPGHVDKVLSGKLVKCDCPYRCKRMVDPNKSNIHPKCVKYAPEGW